MGFISGFFKGAADATADLAKQEIVNRAAAERDEAQFLKQRNLAEMERGWRQEDMGTERGYRKEDDATNRINSREDAAFDRTNSMEDATTKRGWDQEDAETKHGYDKEIAGMRSAKTSKPVKMGEDDMGNAIFGVYNEDTGEFDIVGNSTSGGAGQGGMTLPQAEQAADEWYQKNASMFKSDKSQFGGMTEQQIKAKKVREYMTGSPQSSAANPSATQGGNATAKSGKSAGDYYNHLKGNNPGKTDAELQARVREKFPDYKASTVTQGEPDPKKPANKPDSASNSPDYSRPMSGDIQNKAPQQLDPLKNTKALIQTGKNVGGFIGDAIGSMGESSDRAKSSALMIARRIANKDPSAPTITPELARMALQSSEITPEETAILTRYLSENSN